MKSTKQCITACVTLIISNLAIAGDDCIDNNPFFHKTPHQIGSHVHIQSEYHSYMAGTFRYSQCQTLFMLASRRNVEATHFFDLKKNDQYPYQTDGAMFMAGASVDAIFLQYNQFFFSGGIGMYIKDRNGSYAIVNSEVMFGQRYAIGLALKDFNLELQIQHYSNGGLTNINHGYDLIGFGIYTSW